MRNAILAGMIAIAAAGMAASPAMAQRDPAYAAAREAGRIGEKPDGYLGIVGDADPALQRLVNDINIKRRAIYTQKADEKKTTPEAFALTSGCEAISRTVPGEKYMTPVGTWQTRTEAAPIRDSRCL